jgi:hypothetical protein
MRLLLDECVTNYLKREFVGHEVLTVDEAGFKGLKNGKLLEAATGRFDVLVTVDQNLRFQQNLEKYTLAVLILRAKRTALPFLMPLMPKALISLNSIKSGEVVVVSSE